MSPLILKKVWFLKFGLALASHWWCSQRLLELLSALVIMVAAVYCCKWEDHFDLIGSNLGNDVIEEILDTTLRIKHARVNVQPWECIE